MVFRSTSRGGTPRGAAVMSLATAVALLAAACAPAASPSPTTAPAKAAPTTAPAKQESKPAPTTAPAKAAATQAPAAKATAAPASKPAATELPALTDAQRKAVEDFYRGKTITIIVGLSAGGGFDLMARLVARHIGKHIPGNPNVIVENRTGAGGMVAANHVYNAAPKDGTVIHAASEILLNSQVLKQEGVEYDFAKFQWLGSTQDVTVTCYARTDANVKTLQDVINRSEPLIVGATAPGSNSYDFPVVLKNLLNVNYQIVSGYPGSSQIRLAMESGEVQAHCVPWEAIKPTIKEWLDNKFVNVFVQQAPQRHADLKDVPMAEEFGKTDEEKQVLRLVTISGAISKPFAVAPDVPAERVLALRHAFNSAMKDPALIDEAAKGQIDLSPKPGPQVQQIIEDALKTDPKVVARLKELMQS